MAKITFITGSLLLFLAVSAAAPAENAPGQVREALVAPAAEAEEDLVAEEKEDLKTAEAKEALIAEEKEDLKTAAAKEDLLAEEKEDLKTAEAKEDLVAKKKEDLKTFASHHGIMMPQQYPNYKKKDLKPFASIYEPQQYNYKKEGLKTVALPYGFMMPQQYPYSGDNYLIHGGYGNYGHNGLHHGVGCLWDCYDATVGSIMDNERYNNGRY